MSETAVAAPAASEGTSTAPVENDAQPTNDQGSAVPETPAQRKFRLKQGDQVQEVDGNTLLETLLADLGEDGVVQAAQISREARRRMSEAAKLEKELRAAANDLRDPERAMRLLEQAWGGRENMRRILDDHYARDIEERMLPDDQRKMREMEQKLARYEQMEREARQREEEQQRVTQTQRAQQQLGRAFSESLRSVGIEPTPLNVAKMAQLAEAELSQGVPLDKHVIRDIAKQMAEETQSYTATSVKKLAAHPEQLVQALGEDGVRALNKYLLEKAKASQQQPQPSSARAQPRSDQQPARKQSIHEYYESLKNQK